jgi:hypothetical protein
MARKSVSKTERLLKDFLDAGDGREFGQLAIGGTNWLPKRNPLHELSLFWDGSPSGLRTGDQIPFPRAGD